MAIYVLEFGGQHTDLIGNRLEEMGFSVKYAPSSTRVSDMTDAEGIILSGGPKSVNDPDRYLHDPEIFRGETPVLGICYGQQLLSVEHGARLHRETREYGETIFYPVNHPLFRGLSREEIVWMNHGDSVVPNGNLKVLGYTDKGVTAAVESRRGPYYGVQFHPEVTHTENGARILRNFAENICHIGPRTQHVSDGFDAGKFIEETVYKLKHGSMGKPVIAYTSGGVDSTVAAMLAEISGISINAVYLDMGNGRKGEAEYVSRTLTELLRSYVMVQDVSTSFLEELGGILDPEVKRKAFARLYASTREGMDKFFGLDLGNALLLQGTIATDKRESGKEAGKKSSTDAGTVDTIKTHHNVGAEYHFTGPTLSPLEELTKDRVRAVARALGLPPELSERQPFPGPGLFVRFASGFYPYTDELVGNVNKVARAYGLGGFVLPRKGVGLKGDGRAFEHTALLTGGRDWKNARKASKQLIEDLPISRVLYYPFDVVISQDDFSDGSDIPMTRQNLDRLREVTEIVETTMARYGVKASQTPVIALPDSDGWINVIRDFDSKDFRTGRPLMKPDEFPWECYDEIKYMVGEKLADHDGMTVFDLSDKPGGTTEWE
ncbi:MAG TPA: gamma-glutamyl-gamma-aminobutyrate hydrolase family protein [archaeon]|nr:gamma-glutamyl-gamma-aminobutyrate hydrolase family protein [archaeon]